MQKGTSHTEESRRMMRENMLKKWAAVSKEDRSKIMRERRLKGLNGASV